MSRGRPGILRMLGSRLWPTLPYIGRQGHTWLTVLGLSVTSGCTVVAGQYKQYCTRLSVPPLPSPPCAPLTLTRLVNLGQFRWNGKKCTLLDQ